MSSDGLATFPADQFWFASHGEYDGAPKLSPYALEYGLAACLIGELVLTEFVAVGDGHVYVQRRTPAPADALDHQVLTDLPRKAEVRQALQVVRPLIDRVPLRMERQGLLKAEQVSKLMGLRSQTRWVPVSGTAAAGPTVRLRVLGERIGAGRSTSSAHFGWSDVLLTAIAQATSLLDVVLRGWDSAAESRAGLGLLLNLAEEPALQIKHLADHTYRALGAASVVRR